MIYHHNFSLHCKESKIITDFETILIFHFLDIFIDGVRRATAHNVSHSILGVSRVMINFPFDACSEFSKYIIFSSKSWIYGEI